MILISHVTTAIMATVQILVGQSAADTPHKPVHVRTAYDCGAGKSVICGSTTLTIAEARTAVGNDLATCSKKTEDCPCSGTYNSLITFSFDPKTPQICSASSASGAVDCYCQQ